MLATAVQAISRWSRSQGDHSAGGRAGGRGHRRRKPQCLIRRAGGRYSRSLEDVPILSPSPSLHHHHHLARAAPSSRVAAGGAPATPASPNEDRSDKPARRIPARRGDRASRCRGGKELEAARVCRVATKQSGNGFVGRRDGEEGDGAVWECT